MAKPGRKPYLDPPVRIVTQIPSTLAAKIELLLYDPVLQKPRYGGRAQLITHLLQEWVERQQREATTEASMIDTRSEPAHNLPSA